MKVVIRKLSPKRLFRAKKDHSGVSRSDPSSLGSGSASCSTSSSASSSVHSKSGGSRTPTSVLPHLSGEWSSSDASSDMNYELVRAFTYIDTDKDGVLSKDELESLLSRLGPEPIRPDEAALMLSEVGCHGADARVSIEDLLSRVGSLGELEEAAAAREAELRETFEFFDRDQNGRITAEELLGAFASMGDERCTLEECRRMIAEVDKNRDGFVCFDDFCRMMELQI